MLLIERPISGRDLSLEAIRSSHPIATTTTASTVTTFPFIPTVVERMMALRFSIESIVNSKDNNDNTICLRKTPENGGGKDGAPKTEQQGSKSGAAVRLVDEAKSPFDFSDGSSTSPPSTDKMVAHGSGPQSQTLSFFDVALPHIQMASTNPFLMGLGPHGAASLQPGTSSEMTGAVISMHQQRLWLELLQHSGRSFGWFALLFAFAPRGGGGCMPVFLRQVRAAAAAAVLRSIVIHRAPTSLAEKPLPSTHPSLPLPSPRKEQEDACILHLIPLSAIRTTRLAADKKVSTAALSMFLIILCAFFGRLIEGNMRA